MCFVTKILATVTIHFKLYHQWIVDALIRISMMYNNKQTNNNLCSKKMIHGTLVLL